jgi:L-lactate dehydrogenase complex protein LldG
MKTTNSRENILNKIRQALKEPVPVPFPAVDDNSRNELFPSVNEQAITFAEQFTKLQGKFAYCVDKADLNVQLQALITQKKWTKIYCKEQALLNILPADLTNQLHENVSDCDLSITTCEALVARTGTIVLSSNTESGRTASVYAPIHICIAYASQLKGDIADALTFIQSKYKQLPSLISFATGPSRTADIEKTLVVGVHGPKEVYCFLVEE